nr:reverse transcriptase domain-containing protein [Tanacetum cinerariifolium]
MPFGLKNVGATYQRLMDKAFESQMGRNIEEYVDDLVVKSHTEAEMVRDIEETFRTLRKINMKLNPSLKRNTESNVGRFCRTSLGIGVGGIGAWVAVVMVVMVDGVIVGVGV